MNQKTNFVWEALQLLVKIGEVVKISEDMVAIYTDRGYASGANQITDQDIQSGGVIPASQAGLDMTTLTVTQFNEVATVLTDLIAFMRGTSAPVKVNRMVVYDKYRKDI